MRAASLSGSVPRLLISTGHGLAVGQGEENNYLLPDECEIFWLKNLPLACLQLFTLTCTEFMQ